MSPPREAGGGSRVGEVFRLAWPAALSYLLTNTYRINDQFWIQGVGDAAQAAVGATFFVVIMNFALMFLAVGGTLALVSRATGAGEPATRDSVARHALLFAVGIGAFLTLAVRPLVPAVVGLLGLEGETAELGRRYLGTLYLFSVPLALTAAVDNVFIGRGNTRVPMVLQLVAVSLNFLLNPLLIYGAAAAERIDAPGVHLVSAVARALGFEGWGISGAALATGLSRTITVLAGLIILRLRYGMSWFGSARPRLARIVAIARISAPSSLSIAVYAGVYWALLGLVLARLPDVVTAGLGLGFQVFEGLAFPCYLGVSIAGATLVGRALGARDPEGALELVRSARLLGRLLGIGFALFFLLGAPYVVPLFTEYDTVADATLLYVGILALSQVQVAAEAVNERVLIGAGHTTPIVRISTTGNLLRVPLAALLALGFGFGAAGVWWAINLTTWLKAGLLWREVQRGHWLETKLLESERGTSPPEARGLRDSS